MSDRAFAVILVVIFAGVVAAGVGSAVSGNHTITVTVTASTSTPTTSASTATIGSSATATSSSSSAYTVNVVSTNAKLGSYLVSSTGLTLYYFAPDTVGTASSPPVSACTTAEACLSVWPVFYTPQISVPPGLNASDFSTFTRSDGSNQTAYMGHPLYTYVGDTSPGQTNGQDIDVNGGYWYVATVSGSMP